MSDERAACRDCGQPSVDGFWCASCHEQANRERDAYERERIEAGEPPCDWFERQLKRAAARGTEKEADGE